MSATKNTSQTFAQLALPSGHTISRASFQTDYGLAITTGQDGVVDVQLVAPTAAGIASASTNDKTVGSQTGATRSKQEPPSTGGDGKAAPQDVEEKPTDQRLGYQYYLWPDYGTSFVWYEPGWGGNPDGEDNVEESELRERYSAPWCDALETWVKRYTAAFETRECHLGSGADPFPDVEERKGWVLEGVLLACWLALQPGVDAVGFDAESYQYRVQGEGNQGAPAVLEKLLQDMTPKV